MAKYQAIDELFIAADYTLRFTIFNKAETEIIDVSTMNLSWMIKKKLHDEDSEAWLTKTLADGITIVGVYNPSPSLNTQKVEVALHADDTREYLPRAVHHELKRIDTGFETPYTEGPANFVRGVRRLGL